MPLKMALEEFEGLTKNVYTYENKRKLAS